jgi:hypothetical protein
MRPSFWQTLHARRRREKGDRTQVVAHEDVLVFRKPQQAAAKGDDARRSRVRRVRRDSTGQPNECPMTERPKVVLALTPLAEREVDWRL